MQTNPLEMLLKIILALPLAMCGAIFLYLAIKRGQRFFAADNQESSGEKLRNLVVCTFYIVLGIACLSPALVFFEDLRMFLLVIPTVFCLGVIAIPFVMFGVYFREFQYSRIFGVKIPGKWDRNGNVIQTQPVKQQPGVQRKFHLADIKIPPVVFINAGALAILGFAITSYLLSHTAGNSHFGTVIGLRLVESLLISVYLFGAVVACYIFIQIERISETTNIK